MTRATIDGIPLLDGPLSWTLRPGTTHVEAEFEVQPGQAAKLTSGGLRPVVLDIEGVRFEFLYVTEDRPADSPHTKLIKVVDRRWFWPSVGFTASFNVRRNVGIKRVPGGLGRPVLDPLTPDVKYAPWSLDGGKEWTAERALTYLFDFIAQRESATTGSKPRLVIEPEIASLSGDTLPLENVELADDGAAAFARLLSFIPGADVTVDPDGTVRVYSVISGKEKSVVEKLKEQEGGGHAEFIDNARIRPRRINVYFAPEVELRLDFEEVGDRGTVSRGTEDPWTENVLPIPDFALAVDGHGTLAQGSWITVGQALSAWGAVPNFGRLTFDAIRKAAVPYLDLWAGVQVAGLADKKAVWAGRVAAIQQHYRRTFRVNPRIIQRVQSIRAYRIATIDPAFGTRATSAAYMDWSSVATQRFLSTQVGAGSDSFAYAQNFDGYPASGVIDSTTVASPGKVTVVDADQGIIRLEMVPDEFKLHENMFPGKIDHIPTGKLSAAGIFAWNSRRSGQAIPELRQSFKMATVVTVVPAAPNGIGRMFRVSREPKDLAKVLPSTLSGGLFDARGPELDIFISPGWETARFAWVDRDKRRILRALGIGVGLDEADVSSLADICINLSSQDSLGSSAASLDAIATAVAASAYAVYADRWQGTRTAIATHSLRVEGFVGSILHRVLPDGQALSSVSLQERRPTVDMMSFMPTGTRRMILRLASSGKAP